MHIEYQNREPLDPELEDFARKVAKGTEISSEGLAIYPCNNGGGVYTGRDDGMTIIGISHESQQVLAHEIGHDRHRQVFEGEFQDGEPETNEDGEIVTKGVYNRNDSLDMLINEIFAENVASEYVEDDEEMFRRNPLSNVGKHLESFQKFVSGEKDENNREVNNREIIQKRPVYGGLYFRNPTKHQDYEAMIDEIRSRLDSGEEDIIELKTIIYNTWAERVHKTVIRDEDDIVWEGITQYLDEEINTEEVVWHSIEDKYGQIVRENVEENLDRILWNISTSCTSRIAKNRLRNELPNENNLEEVSTSNPAHLSSMIQSGNLEILRTDYNHDIGNYVGRILHDIGISHDILENNEEELRELGRRSIDLAMEMGRYESEFYDKEDYKNGIEFIANDIGLL